MTAHDDRPDPGVHQPPPGAHLMNLVRWGLFGVLIVLAAVSIGSYVVSRQQAGRTTASATKVLYHCPMHPSYTSDKPGECPICGMSLEPIEPAASTPAGTDAHDGNVPGLTTVHITPERIQLIGVRTAPVRESSLGDQLDLVGFVAPDETRLKRVQLRVSGWVRRLYVNQTGEQVGAGQPLLAIYSPELYQTEQEYLIERAAADSGSALAGTSHRAGEQRLRLLGVPEEEIRRLAREGTATTDLVLRSPVTGTVMERSVLEGQFVRADTPLLTVADLGRVWVMADLYEMDIDRIRVGDAARFVIDALPGRTFRGRVEFVYPTVSNETRTIKARVSLANPDGLLRPGMYGTVRVASRGAPGLSIPAEAVVNTGEHQYVFLTRPGGRFEPRMVTTGISDNGRLQVLQGLAPGDTVVASASFLIDSESRLQAAIAGMGSQPGMAGMDHDHGGGQ